MASHKNCSGRIAVLMLLGLLLGACSGDDGAAGAVGATGATGPAGPPGPTPPPPVDGIIIGDGSELTELEIEYLGKLQATITAVPLVVRLLSISRVLINTATRPLVSPMGSRGLHSPN